MTPTTSSSSVLQLCLSGPYQKNFNKISMNQCILYSKSFSDASNRILSKSQTVQLAVELVVRLKRCPWRTQPIAYEDSHLIKFIQARILRKSFLAIFSYLKRSLINTKWVRRRRLAIAFSFKNNFACVLVTLDGRKLIFICGLSPLKCVGTIKNRT